MTDIVDSRTRSRMMAGIRAKDTRPEMALRRGLHVLGFRYRLHAGDVPGRPDLVLPKHRAVIFVHGCFWHRHPGCRFASNPSTRREFWEAKFEANMRRDVVVRASLLAAGWRVATVWECRLRKPADVQAVTEAVAAWLKGGETVLEVG